MSIDALNFREELIIISQTDIDNLKSLIRGNIITPSDIVRSARVPFVRTAQYNI